MELLANPLFGQSSCIAYWRFEGNSNDSKLTHNGTDTSITYSSANGKFQQGAGFDGAASFISLADAADLKPATTISVGAWMKTSSATNQWIIQDYNSLQGWQLDFLGGVGLKYIRFELGNGTDDASADSSVATYEDGLWHHVVGTYDGTTMRLYVDGVANGTNTTTRTISYNDTTFPRIGKQQYVVTSTNFFNGALDDIFMFNRTLSASEVFDIYQTRYPTLLGV